MRKVHSVEEYILESGKWQKSIQILREILLFSGLQEAIKWSMPVYSLENKNIIGMAAFKEHVALWFFQGALFKDRQHKFVVFKEGQSKAMRQWRFTAYAEIEADLDSINAYVIEAIENQRKGLEIKPERNKPVVMPPELEAMLNADVELKKCFDKFSQSDRRYFARYIESAKRTETKESRLLNITPMIFNGVGLNDKYKNKK